MFLLAALGFAQANLAYAFCEMDRRALAQVVQSGSEQACECETGMASQLPLATNRCVAHCTADLQIAAAAVPIGFPPAEAAVLIVPRADAPLGLRADPEAAPVLAVPLRILLHSFLI